MVLEPRFILRSFFSLFYRISMASSSFAMLIATSPAIVSTQTENLSSDFEKILHIKNVKTIALDRKNHFSWRAQFIAFLRSNNQLQFVDGSVKIAMSLVAQCQASFSRIRKTQCSYID